MGLFASRPDGKYGVGHHNIVLNPERGMTILDVVDGVIKSVELIDRPEVKQALEGSGQLARRPNGTNEG